jgi:cation transport ATPase
VFLFSLRAVVTIAYSDDVSLTVRVLFIKIKILPKKDKRKKIHSMSRKKAEKIKKQLAAKEEKQRKKKQLKQEKKQEKKKQKEKEPKPKKSLSEILDLIGLAVTLVKTVLKCFFGHLRVDVARFRIKVATGDPATTAVAYGAVSQAVSYLLALLQNNKNVRGLKKADLDIGCDFIAESISADIELSFSMRVWHVFHIAFAALGSLIKNRVKSAMKKSKRSSPALMTLETNSDKKEQ